MQIATWEIVRENSGTLNVYNGNVYFNNSGYADLAQTYLDYITANAGPMRYNILGAAKVGNQDPWLPVPEPAFVILLGLGFAAAAIFKQRIR